MGADGRDVKIRSRDRIGHGVPILAVLWPTLQSRVNDFVCPDRLRLTYRQENLYCY